MSNCPIDESIAIHCNEDEEFCSVCGSTMTHDEFNGTEWLRCDKCSHIKYLGDDE